MKSLNVVIILSIGLWSPLSFAKSENPISTLEFCKKAENAKAVGKEITDQECRQKVGFRIQWGLCVDDLLAIKIQSCLDSHDPPARGGGDPHRALIRGEGPWLKSTRPKPAAEAP